MVVDFQLLALNILRLNGALSLLHHSTMSRSATNRVRVTTHFECWCTQSHFRHHRNIIKVIG